MFFFAHHMGVEILGREFSPHGVVEHICVFTALALILGTSAYGTWVLATKVLDSVRGRRNLTAPLSDGRSLQG
jgi:hypothetical protein